MSNEEGMAVDSNVVVEEDVDIDEMSSCASRTTLAGMQQLWRQHAAIMDAHGKHCAEALYMQHSKALQDLAAIKQFDLKATLAVVNKFVGAVRDNVLGVFSTTRQQDDAFAQQLYQTTRTAFTRNLKAAMEARDAWYQEKVKALQARHQASLAAARSASAVEIQQLKSALAKATAAAAVVKPAAPKPATPLEAKPVEGGDTTPEGGAADAEADSEAMEVLRPQIEALQMGLEEANRELASWKSKWAIESSRADAVKRECMQVVLKCEDHVARLQQLHIAELNHRDIVLQRCKETILQLEARLPEKPAGGTAL